MSGSDFGGYRNPAADRLINEAAASADTATATIALNKAAQLIADDAYTRPLYQRPTLVGGSPFGHDRP